jgi:uncharacterized protein YigA (DUF484 family)
MTAAMDANEIANYLKSHPEFFEQYAELLSQIHIPSPHGGKAVSITERQMGTLRDKVKQLESKLAELIRFGEDNDAIAAKVHRLGLALQGDTNLEAALRTIYSHLGEAFAVPHVAIRIWGIGRGDGVEFAPVDDGIKAFISFAKAPYCGSAAGQQAVASLGEAGSHVRSVAQIPLREGETGACIGMLLLASEEAQRFYPEMGTLYLEQIGDIAGAALLRVIG